MDEERIKARYVKACYDWYRDTAETLSEAPASVLENCIQFGKIYGYIAQNGKKYKFVRVEEDRVNLVIYVGDDIEGTIKNFCGMNLSRFLQRLNPYLKQDDTGAADIRYRCDLNGKLQGLKAIKPDFNLPNSHSPEDCKKIKQIILSKKCLGDRYLWEL